MTVEEAAQRLGVDYKTVYFLVRNGELPAGKVGRVYRIREADLDAYFERQKQLVAGRAQEAAEQRPRCGGCGKEILSKLSVAGRCSECGREICQACWAVKKVRSCSDHKTPAGDSGKPDGDVSQPGASGDSAEREERPREGTSEKIARLREQGRQVVTAEEAALGEESFLRAFGQRLEEIERVDEPLSGRTIELAKARVRHDVEATAKGGRGDIRNRLSRFTLRTGGWGKPKSCLVLEARYFCRPERISAQGYDAEPIGKGELESYLNDLAKRAAKGECFHVVLLGSPTGWADGAKAMVCRSDGAKGFRDRRAAVVLEDLHDDQSFLDDSDKRLWPLWQAVAPRRFCERVNDCIEAIRGELSGRRSVSLNDAVKACGCGELWVRSAFDRLAEDGEYSVDELDDIGLVISPASG